MVRIIKHDITAVGELPRLPHERIAIAHGVNCQGSMGAGVAKVLYSKWKQVKYEYIRRHNLIQPCLGHIQDIDVGEDIIVFNCWTQKTYGAPGTGVHADLRAIKTCLRRVVAFCAGYGIKTVYTPMIGCGLGGLNWAEVSKIYDEVQHETPGVEIVVCVNS